MSDTCEPPRGRGRPKLGRSKKITVSFTEEEYADILMDAALARQNLNEWVRAIILKTQETT